MSWRAWLDSTPIANIALALMRDATGRDAPLATLQPVRAALRAGCVIGCWSLNAGVGGSTLAALIAHRSAAGGRAPMLIDLDRRAPVLALRAERRAATISDALLRPEELTSLTSRWGDVPFLPGCSDLSRTWDGPRIAGIVSTLRAQRPVVLDLGNGAESLDPDVLSTVDRLLIAVGPTVAQLQSTFCSIPLVDGSVNAAAVIIGVEADDGARIGARLPWPVLGTIPRDPYLANDQFAARAPTSRAIDRVIRGLG